MDGTGSEHHAFSGARYTGAEIAEAASTGGLIAIRNHLKKFENAEKANENKKELKITMEDIEKALEKVKPIQEREATIYREAAKNFLAH